MMDINDLLYKIAFASIKGMSFTLARELLKDVLTESNFFNLSEAQLQEFTKSKSRIYSRAYRDKILSEAELELKFISTHNIKVLYYTSAEYPQRLLECEDGPLILYGIGDTNLNAAHSISIVGTRHATHYGIDFTNKLVSHLEESVDTPIIVSGLAYGIDITAHRASLKHNIPTVAVLAHGLNTIYPSEHRNDAIQIVKHGGMLITDYRSSDKIHKGSFLARNRIIAGISDCTVVAESAQTGGALVTARIASEYGRDVFALPGRISDKYSIGCNQLISNNIAALLNCPSDLSKAMRWRLLDKKSETPPLPMVLSEEETHIIEFLRQNEDATTNRVSVSLNIPIGKLLSTLIDMEFRGLLTVLPGGRYQLQ